MTSTIELLDDSEDHMKWHIGMISCIEDSVFNYYPDIIIKFVITEIRMLSANELSEKWLLNIFHQMGGFPTKWDRNDWINAHDFYERNKWTQLP